MGTTVEQRRRISRYAILVLFMFLVAGSLSTENHWPVFAAITGPADAPAPGGDVASAAFEMRDIRPAGDVDASHRLRDIARDTLAAAGIGGGNRPADQDRPPEVEPLEFVAAAANPPESPPPAPAASSGRPDITTAGGGCNGNGRGSGFVPPGCLVREVAWTINDPGVDHFETVKSLRKTARDAVEHNWTTHSAHLDRVSSASRPERPLTASRPERPERPEITSSRPERPERPEPPNRPDRGPR